MFDHPDCIKLLSSNQINKIENYIHLLKQYNESINIYSKKSYDKLAYHSFDSILLAKKTRGVDKVVDIGSGSGLPGIILAICNNSNIVCVESKQKKRQFLHHIKKELGLTNLEVFDGDVQSYVKIDSGSKIGLITAKAFAKPPKLIFYLQMFNRSNLNNNAVCWVPISDNQKVVLSGIVPIVESSIANITFNYMRIEMTKLKIYKDRLKNQYNL